MGKLKLTQIGPWSGVNNVHPAEHEVFQLRKDFRTALLSGTNIDLNDDGWSSVRAEFVQQLSFTNPRTVFSALGLVLVQDGGSIYSVDLTAQTSTLVVSGLDADEPVSWLAHAGQVWWMTTTQTGRITQDYVAANWGLPSANTPQLAEVAGSLCPGIYSFVATYLDAYDVEHSASDVAAIQIGDAGCTAATTRSGISVTVPFIDSRAAYVRLYVSEANGSELYHAGDVLPGSFPVQVTSGGNAPWSDRSCPTLHTQAPVPGHGLFGFEGSIITYKDDTLFGSLGIAHHVFPVGMWSESRPSAIKAGAGLSTGFWTTTSNGAFWSVAQPNGWYTEQRDDLAYAAGTIKLNARFLPTLGRFDEVAVFVGAKGVVAALPDGVLAPLTQDSFHFDVEDKKAIFALRQLSSGPAKGTRQIAFTLVDEG